jgi:UDP-N-acetylglucosamine 2-epimerase (non-hydrolysing)
MLADPSTYETIICSTGQQKDLIPISLSEFGLKADIDLNVMTPDQTLSTLTAKLVDKLGRVIHDIKPDLVLVQGDTTSALAGSLTAFYHQIPTAHIEAGLRTNDKYSPFPEEINRKLIAQCTSIHFSVTKTNRQNLINENINPSTIFVTGNTVIDALLFIRDQLRNSATLLSDSLMERIDSRSLVLITTHRRENFGKPLADICDAVRFLSDKYSDMAFVYLVHPNPNVKKSILSRLSQSRVILAEPLTYRPFIELMDKAKLILTDSGGIQEEAPSLGIPVLVLRTTTERQEAIDAGTARLVGTNINNIINITSNLIEDADAYNTMAHTVNPYGDGKATERILNVLREWIR